VGGTCLVAAVYLSRRAAIASASVTENELTVVRRPDERRYELLLAGEHVGELVYRERGGDVVAFLHTEVDPNVQRRGLGTALVVGALDDARDRGQRVVPICPFVDAYIRRHPDYADLAVSDPARRP